MHYKPHVGASKCDALCIVLYVKLKARGSSYCYFVVVAMYYNYVVVILLVVLEGESLSKWKIWRCDRHLIT